MTWEDPSPEVRQAAAQALGLIGQGKVNSFSTPYSIVDAVEGLVCGSTNYKALGYTV